MRAKEFGFLLAFLLIVVISVACTPTKTSQKASEGAATVSPAPEAGAAQVVAVPQLENEGREDASTMVLLNSPPMLPADHNNRWNPDLRQDSCMVCHATPETGAPIPTAEHYYDNQLGGVIFREYCIQCHAEQNDTKAAFNQ